VSARLKVAVLGGGLSGLRLGARLKERGAAFSVFEARDTVGGLGRTLEKAGYRWDIGPHAFYSKDASFVTSLRALAVDYAEHARRVRVCHRGADGTVRELGYPFENGLADLPLKERWECVAGYIKSAMHAPPSFENLEHWIERGLGPGIARQFMRPYNEKIWDCPLGEISMALVRGKIDPEPLWRIIRNALFKGSVGRAYQARFLYPENGAGAVPDALAAPIKDSVRTGWPLRRLEEHQGGWRLHPKEGAPVEADAVVSTIPVPLLLDCLQDAELAGLRDAFRHNDTAVVVVGLAEGAKLGRFADCHWVFFAGPEIFYRVTFIHNLRGFGPPTLVAEITRRAGTAPDEAVFTGAHVLRDLADAGIVLSQDDVRLLEWHVERFTYPIPTVGLDAARARVEGALAPKKLFLLGRSGRWDYLNTDGVLAAADAFAGTRLQEVLA